MAEEIRFHEVFRRLVFGQLRPMGKHDLKVLLVILQHRNSVTGYAWPSLEKIAKLTTGSKSSVIAALKRLESNGLIKTIRKGGGRRQSTYRIITLPEVPGEDETVPATGTESEPEKTVPRSRVNGTTSDIETVPSTGRNGTTYGAKTVPATGTRIKESTENKSPSKHSDPERCDDDSLNPSGFDWEAELAVDKDKPGSPFKLLTDLEVSEAAAANSYKFQGLGRAGPQAILDLDAANFKTGMYTTWNRESYLGQCCWHPKPDLVRAARRLRREWDKAKPRTRPRPRVIPDDESPQTRSDARHDTPKAKRRIPSEDPETGIHDHSRMIEVDDEPDPVPVPSNGEHYDSHAEDI